MKITLMGTKLFLAMVLAFAASNAFAVGFGFTLGSGTETWDSGSTEDDNPNFEHHDGDRKVDYLGFVLDTAIAKDKLFNYRFSLLSEENNADASGYNIDMKGISTVHDFGFGVVRNRVMRLWIGPELRLSYYNDISPSFATSRQFDGEVVGLSVGPAIGLNIHLPRVVSFSVAGVYYIASQYAGQYDVTDSNGVSYGTVDVEDSSNGLYITASILFRFNDNY